MAKEDDALQTVYTTMRTVGMSTADIMLALVRALYKVSQNISNEDRSLRDAAILNSYTADTRSELKDMPYENPAQSPHARLKRTLNAAEAKADELGTMKSTAPLVNEAKSRLDSVNGQIADLSQTRETLLTDVSKLKEEQEKEVAELFDRYKENKITPAELKAKLDEIKQRQERITQSLYDKVIPTEEKVQRKATDEYITNAQQVAAGKQTAFNEPEALKALSVAEEVEPKRPH